MSVKVRPFKGQSGRWEVDIRFEWPDGSRHRERVIAPGSTKSAAQRWGEARERELLDRGKKDPQEVAREVPTLAQFKARYIEDFCVAERQKPSTIEHKEIAFRAHLLPLLGEKKLDQIGSNDVARLKASMANQSPKSVNNVLTILSTVLKKAIEWKVIDYTHCTIKLLKVHYGERSFYEFHELERLLDGAKKVDPRVELVVLLGSNGGLRRGEILALRWVNVLLDRGILRIAESEFNGIVSLPKSGRHRDVPLSGRLLAALKAHRHLKGPRVLYNDGGDTVGPDLLRSWMKSAQRRAGLEVNGNVHILRHTFCSHLAILGAPAKAIQELAGHADLTTTMRYMHLSPAARSEAIGLLNKQPTEATRLHLQRAEEEPTLVNDDERGDLGETGRIRVVSTNESGATKGAVSSA